MGTQEYFCLQNIAKNTDEKLRLQGENGGGGMLAELPGITVGTSFSERYVLEHTPKELSFFYSISVTKIMVQ